MCQKQNQEPPKLVKNKLWASEFWKFQLWKMHKFENLNPYISSFSDYVQLTISGLETLGAKVRGQTILRAHRSCDTIKENLLVVPGVWKSWYEEKKIAYERQY